MVKGVSKRVVTIRFPDSHIFEQAIFMVREDLKARSVSASDVIREACDIADRHTSPTAQTLPRRRRRKASLWSQAAYIGLGSALTGLVWLCVAVLT